MHMRHSRRNALWACTLILLSSCSPPAAPPQHDPEAPPNAPFNQAQHPPEAAPVPTELKATDPAPESTAPTESGATPSEALPEVRLVTTAELGAALEKTLGKVTVLNIWATWCVPCVKEMPDFVTLYKESDPASFALVSLSIDEAAEITGAIPEFQRTHGMPFPVLVLNERDDEALLKALRGKFSGMIPTTFVYDKTGALVKLVEGPITLAELREIVTPLLGASS